MSQIGIYKVGHRRSYRGHAPGTTFEARLDPGAEQRALQRGDIELVRRTVPALQPGSFTLPRGWLNPNRNEEVQ